MELLFHGQESDVNLRFQGILSWNVDFMILSLGADLHSSNTRVKNAVRDKASRHNQEVLTNGRQAGSCGYVGIIDVHCIGFCATWCHAGC